LKIFRIKEPLVMGFPEPFSKPERTSGSGVLNFFSEPERTSGSEFFKELAGFVKEPAKELVV
jgi:hypothetical protein